MYAMNSDMEIVTANLTHSAKVASEWYTLNSFKEILKGIESCNNIDIVIDNEVVVSSTDFFKLHGVSIDRHLRFDDHIIL